ncbi:hypothetical protein BD413DRAFT_210303 [Trametes elegans]|nr:hypothetical protein BD413DRAFT_210303 [Trametes elegans]
MSKVNCTTDQRPVPASVHVVVAVDGRRNVNSSLEGLAMNQFRTESSHTIPPESHIGKCVRGIPTPPKSRREDSESRVHSQDSHKARLWSRDRASDIHHLERHRWSMPIDSSSAVDSSFTAILELIAIDLCCVGAHTTGLELAFLDTGSIRNVTVHPGMRDSARTCTRNGDLKLDRDIGCVRRIASPRRPRRASVRDRTRDEDGPSIMENLPMSWAVLGRHDNAPPLGVVFRRRVAAD